MNSDIRFSGLDASASPYDAPDGSLDLSLNLINEDGALHPIPQPAVRFTLSPGDRIILSHSVMNSGSPADNFFILRSSGSFYTILWFTGDNPASATSLAVVRDYHSSAIIGNTVIIATSSGLKYFIYKDSGYTSLDSRPPFVPVTFGMKQRSLAAETLKAAFPECLTRAAAQMRSDQEREARKAALSAFSDAVHGYINSTVAEHVTSKGLFHMPFFVRYAFRLYDGSYSWHSAPVLMLPTVLPPVVKVSDPDDEYVTLSALFKAFVLKYRVLEVPPYFDDWKDIVTGIDIFVSAPLYTYDPSRNIENHPLQDYHTLVLSCATPAGRPGLDNNDPAHKETVFIGSFAGEHDEVYQDRDESFLTNQNITSFKVANIPLLKRFHQNVRDCSAFYKVASLDFDNIKAMDEMEILPLDNEDATTGPYVSETKLDNIVTRPALPDDFRSHFPLRATWLYAFNSRLNLAGVSIAPAPPLPLQSCVRYGNMNETRISATLTVWSRINGVRCFAINADDSIANSLSSSVHDFPRYLFYPDASAYKMRIAFKDRPAVVIPLKPHDFLNGAYYYNPDFTGTPYDKVEPLAPENDVETGWVDMPSKVYTSEVNNPFLFPAAGINTVRSGRVMALSSAVRALSQGQFGQYPLYAFSTEGVWALEVGSTGAFTSVRPVARDVCLNTAGITQIDFAVLFPSARGIMLIAGSQVECISEPVNNRSLLSFPFPGPSSFPVLIPFLDFIRECAMLYDYVRRRIIVFNSGAPYAYVLSLKSKLWGMMESSLQYPVNSYPEALAVDTSGSLVDFSSSDHFPPGLLLSRPLSFGAPDVLKTVSSLFIRGYFSTGHVSSALYGSRDLINWSLVNSSVTHRLLNRRGTPYKYFRLILFTGLSSGESVSAFSLWFDHRLVNRLR